MKFYYGQDAIHEFQQRTRFLKNSRLYWCALVVSWTNEKPAPWVRDVTLVAALAHQLEKSLAAEENKAFLLALPSGDLVVLGETVSNAAYKRMKYALEASLAEMIHEDVPVCHSYDLSVDWETFLEACRDVYSRLGHIQTQVKQSDKSSLLKRLDESLAAASGLIRMRSVKPKSLNLLFVEDEPTIRQLLNNLLGDSGHSLSFAASGTDAVEAYARKAPHIVFLDINLPDISGLDVLELISKHDRQAHAVMLTSGSAQAQVQTAVQQGVKGYIVKPFSRQKLIDCIERYYA